MNDFQKLRYTLAVTWCLAAALMCYQPADAQQCTPLTQEDRPRIGLVLGGGGARGGAHVGVLRFLEENRIPVDVIAGTSMGSIIGGLYAAGLTAREIESALVAIDWNAMFSDATPRSQRPLRRKRDDDLGLFGPKLGIGSDSTVLPSGAVAGQKIGLLMEQLVSNETRVENFDELPIPFRAVAADLVTGDIKVLDSGKLSLAMRASMSVPGAFDPIRMGDSLLVDGGIVQNLPIETARDMQADVVIAVDVAYPKLPADQLDNLLAVVSQLTTLMVSENTERQIASLAPGDVLLEPKLGIEFGSADFDRIEEVIPLGFEAASSSSGRLTPYALDSKSYGEWRSGINRCRSEPGDLQFVRLENNSRFSDEVLMEKIRIQAGQSVNYEELDRDIARIYGLGFIRTAQYRIVEENGETGVVIEVEQDKRGLDFIETGLNISSGPRGSNLDLKAAYLKTDLNKRGAEFRGAIQVGEDAGLLAELYMPLDNRLRWILQPNITATRRDIQAWDESGNLLAIVEAADYGTQISFGREFGRHAGLFGSVARYAGKLDLRVGSPGFDPYRYDGGEWSIWGLYDRLDNRYIPSEGSIIRARYVSSRENLGADQEFEQLELAFFSAFTRGAHTAWIGSRFDYSFQNDLPIYALYTGGGFLSMSGFQRDELIGANFGMSLLGYRYRLTQSGFLPGYVGMTVEYGGASDRASDVYSDGTLNGSVYFAYDTPLGPMYLGYGWNEAQSGLFFLRFGTILGDQNIGRH